MPIPAQSEQTQRGLRRQFPSFLWLFFPPSRPHECRLGPCHFQPCQIGWNPPCGEVTGPSVEIKSDTGRAVQGTRAATSPSPGVVRRPTPHTPSPPCLAMGRGSIPVHSWVMWRRGRGLVVSCCERTETVGPGSRIFFPAT